MSGHPKALYNARVAAVNGSAGRDVGGCLEGLDGNLIELIIAGKTE